MNRDVLARPVLRYTRVAVILHWMIAAFIGFNFAVGYIMEDLGPKWRTFVVEIHISSGMTVLLLSLFRVAWRLTHKPPPRPGDPVPEKYLARIVHLGLYSAMLLMPLTGWALVSAHPPAGSAGALYTEAHQPAAVTAAQHRRGPVTYWRVVDLPLIEPVARIGAEPVGVARQHELHERFDHWHVIGSFLLLGLLALHIAGALKHQWFDGEAELARMAIAGKTVPHTGTQ